MTRLNQLLALVLGLTLVATACSSDDESGPVTITLITHDSFEVTDSLLADSPPIRASPLKFSSWEMPVNSCRSPS